MRIAGAEGDDAKLVAATKVHGYDRRIGVNEKEPKWTYKWYCPATDFFHFMKVASDKFYEAGGKKLSGFVVMVDARK